MEESTKRPSLLGLVGRSEHEILKTRIIVFRLKTLEIRHELIGQVNWNVWTPTFFMVHKKDWMIIGQELDRVNQPLWSGPMNGYQLSWLMDCLNTNSILCLFKGNFIDEGIKQGLFCLRAFSSLKISFQWKRCQLNEKSYLELNVIASIWFKKNCYFYVIVWKT